MTDSMKKNDERNNVEVEHVDAISTDDDNDVGGNNSINLSSLRDFVRATVMEAVITPAFVDAVRSGTLPDLEPATPVIDSETNVLSLGNEIGSVLDGNVNVNTTSPFADLEQTLSTLAPILDQLDNAMDSIEDDDLNDSEDNPVLKKIKDMVRKAADRSADRTAEKVVDRLIARMKESVVSELFEKKKESNKKRQGRKMRI